MGNVSDYFRKGAKELPVNIEDFVVYTIAFAGVQNEKNSSWTLTIT